MSDKSYSDQFVTEIELIISPARLTRYMAAAAGDLRGALSLYEQNVSVSEALFGLLHGLEVAVRNSIHGVLSQASGHEDWFAGFVLADGLRMQPTKPMQDMVATARRKAGQSAPIGKVIAELTFGFWPSLASGSFHPLWSKETHRGFPHLNRPRSFLHRRLEVIRYLRNRIAHHEPILTSRSEVYTGHPDQLYIALPALLECAGWISPAAAIWLQDTTRYNQAAAILAAIQASGLSL